MPNLQKMMVHQQRADIFSKALKDTQHFIDSKALVLIDGERKLMTATEIAAAMDTENAAARAAGLEA